MSKTVTSLAVGMLEGDGALSLDDPVLAHLPELAGTAAAGSERITVGHLLRMTAGNGYRWLDEDADIPKSRSPGPYTTGHEQKGRACASPAGGCIARSRQLRSVRS
ncbi:MAG: serine hydrolase domain-containing protein, partial [Streptosporangiaceae bacterium]